MLSRLSENLKKIAKLRMQPGNDVAVYQEKLIALKLMRLIPAQALCEYRDSQNENFVIFFTLSDLVAGLEYLASHDETLLTQMTPLGANPWSIALRWNSRNVIAYLLAKLDNQPHSLFANELQRATIRNDVNKVREILATSDSISRDVYNSDPMEDGALLNHGEIVKVFFENEKFRAQFDVELALEAAIFNQHEKISSYIVDQMIAQDRISKLNTIIVHLYHRNQLNKNFIESYLQKLLNHSALTSEQKSVSIKVCIYYLFEYAHYESLDDFKKLFDQAWLVLRENDVIKSEFITYMRKLLRPMNTREQKYEPQQLPVLDKIGALPELAFNQLFTPALQAPLAQQAFLTKAPLGIMYFLDGIDLNYTDKDGNNLAHLAMQSVADFPVYWLFTRNPQLFQARNNAGKTPIEMIPTVTESSQNMLILHVRMAPLQTLMQPEWKVYHKLRAGFFKPENFYNYTVVHPVWGSIVCKHAATLDQVERVLNELQDSKLNARIMKHGYDEMANAFFSTMRALWLADGYNQTAIVELLKKYVAFAKKHSLFKANQQASCVQLFFRFQKNAEALDEINAILKREQAKITSVEVESKNAAKNTAQQFRFKAKAPSPANVTLFDSDNLSNMYTQLITKLVALPSTETITSIITTRIYELTKLSLLISVASNANANPLSFSQTDNSQSAELNLLRASIAPLLASTESQTTVPLPQLRELKEKITEMNLVMTKGTPADSLDGVQEFIDSCKILLQWAKAFFNFDADLKNTHATKIFILEVKLILLEKVRALNYSVYHFIEKYHHEHYILNKAKNMIEDFAQEIKATRTAKIAFQNEPTESAGDDIAKLAATSFSAYRPTPSFFDQRRVVPLSVPTDKLSAHNRLQHRYLDPKTPAYAAERQAAALDCHLDYTVKVKGAALSRLHRHIANYLISVGDIEGGQSHNQAADFCSQQHVVDDALLETNRKNYIFLKNWQSQEWQRLGEIKKYFLAHKAKLDFYQTDMLLKIVDLEKIKKHSAHVVVDGQIWHVADVEACYNQSSLMLFTEMNHVETTLKMIETQMNALVPPAEWLRIKSLFTDKEKQPATKVPIVAPIPTKRF